MNQRILTRVAATSCMAIIAVFVIIGYDKSYVLAFDFNNITFGFSAENLSIRFGFLSGVWGESSFRILENEDILNQLWVIDFGILTETFPDVYFFQLGYFYIITITLGPWIFLWLRQSQKKGPLIGGSK